MTGLCVACGGAIRLTSMGVWGHERNPGRDHHYARPASPPRTPQEPLGTGEPTIAPDAAEVRFWARVRVSDGCWEWAGEVSRGGYGRLVVAGRRVQAHRRSWELTNGPIPAGLFVCHHCDNPPCVRPDHLFLGTVRDNALDMVAKGRAPSGDRSGSRLHPETVARGERVSTAKLTADAVRVIRAAVLAGAGKAELARRFGVSDTAIRYAASGASWKHVA